MDIVKSLAARWAAEVAGPLCKSDQDEVTDVLTKYAAGERTYEAALTEVHTISGDIVPVERMKAIIDISDDPLTPRSPQNVSAASRPGGQQWTLPEDRRLLAAVIRFGLSDWIRVAQFVGGGRTRSQCSQRWTRSLDPAISREKWSKEDEMKLIELVESLPLPSWETIAEQIGNRTGPQCRYRYGQLRPKLKPEPAHLDVKRTRSQCDETIWDAIPSDECDEGSSAEVGTP